MNRFYKEQIRKSLHSSMDYLTERQRREFVYRFTKNPDLSSKSFINQIDNKSLKIAQRHVQNILEQNLI